MDGFVMADKEKKISILFVCTGNACRSQMAEAWAVKLKSDRIDAYSGGTHAAGRVSARVIQVMTEVGIDMSDHWSKQFDYWQDIDFDYVITMCDYAQLYCPVFAAPTQMVHHHFPDPMGIIGNDQQTMDAFRRVRDKIRDYVSLLPESISDILTEGE